MHRDVNTEISRLGGLLCYSRRDNREQINLLFHCIYCVTMTDSPGSLLVSHCGIMTMNEIIMTTVMTMMMIFLTWQHGSAASNQETTRHLSLS